LFVIALLVPAIFATARYFESDRQMTQIAQAQSKPARVASANGAQANLRVASAESRGR
jgi:hypothetical protein